MTANLTLIAPVRCRSLLRTWTHLWQICGLCQVLN